MGFGSIKNRVVTSFFRLLFLATATCYYSQLSFLAWFFNEVLGLNKHCMQKSHKKSNLAYYRVRPHALLISQIVSASIFLSLKNLENA